MRTERTKSPELLWDQMKREQQHLRCQSNATQDLQVLNVKRDSLNEPEPMESPPVKEERPVQFNSEETTT